MHLLILSANTGEGHNSAARAVKEYFESQGCSCEIANGLSFMSRASSELICRGHVFLYRRLPRVYGAGYRFEEFQAQHQRYQRALEKSVARKKRRRENLPVLQAFISDGAYDAVLCVHVFAARMVSELRKRNGLSIPCFFLATDYTCSPGVNQLDMDGWFIPHEALIPEFSSYGIPTEKLIPSGIPVRGEFFHRGEKAAIRRELGLPTDKKIALLSCGSMGAGPMGKMVLLLTEALPDDALLLVVCGNNRGLERRLKGLIRSSKLQVFGFVDRLADYMDAADLFLTKPGGLSTTEAVHKGVPLMVINVVPGCETHNQEFLTELGCAVGAGGALSLVRLACATLKDDGALHSLTERCRQEFSFDPRKIIYDTIKKSCFH